MAQSTSKKKARLAKAHDRRQPVEVRLKTPWKDSPGGYVVALANGVWAEGAGWRRIDNILRVDTGGRYLKAYERFGEPRPERP